MIEDTHTYLQAEEAHVLAAELHADRQDLMGLPEFAHISWVAERVSDGAKVAAWLHDSVEDGLITFKALVERYKLSPTDYGAVTLLTRQPGSADTYRRYVQRIASALGPQGTVAREVKSFDLNHNRIRPCPDELFAMRTPIGRYAKAQRVIRGAQEHHGEPVTGMSDREMAALAGINPLAFPA